MVLVSSSSEEVGFGEAELGLDEEITLSIRHFLGRAALASALTFAVTPAFAGKLFISGQDSDDSGHVSVAFGTQLLDFLSTGNTNAGSGILILGGYTAQSATTINNWNATPSYTLTASSGAAAITAQSFAGYAAILMPSADSQTSGGITQAELDAINARAGDIATFVNAGGNLMAFTQIGLTGSFGWFPLGALSTSSISTADVSQTAALLAAGLTATDPEIAGDLYHNNFTGPSGFFGLSVLARDNATNEAVILGGGVETQITTPEPASLAILAMGLAGLGAIRRRRAA